MSYADLKTPFNKNYRELVAREVVKQLKKELPGINIDWSHECGFTLPLYGTKWTSKDYGETLNSLLDYHNTRQFRFTISDENITGLRTKDGIEYWDDHEKNLIIDMVNDVVILYGL